MGHLCIKRPVTCHILHETSSFFYHQILSHPASDIQSPSESDEEDSFNQDFNQDLIKTLIKTYHFHRWRQWLALK